MRYQQVYNASLFTNLDSGLIYLTTLTFMLESPNQNRFLGWTVNSMQINLSTTQKGADGLSTNFNENVGDDDKVVFGPAEQAFLSTGPDGPLLIPLDRPFRYSPALGNLLLDVRIFDGSGLNDMFQPYLETFDSPTDEVSRVWATKVTATTATGVDTMGLTTLIQFSPIPALTAEFRAFICAGCPTNVIQISWPSEPSVFQLQQSDQPGTNSVWGSVNTQIFDNGDDRFIWIPQSSASAHAYYRLVWPGGQ